MSPVLSAPVHSHFTFGHDRYEIRIANDLETRRRAYRLVYNLYLEKGYARPNSSKMWLGIFNALPETTTLVVECEEDIVGTLTVVFDSALGLPADAVYRGELDSLRRSGQKPSEIISLAVSQIVGRRASQQILAKLFNFAYLLARRIRGATHFVITVNPRHADYYRRALLFKEQGAIRNYDKVSGAPAVLLSIALDTPDWIDIEERRRTLYKFWHREDEEPAIVAGLESEFRRMSVEELRYFFVEKTDIWARAAPQQKACVLRRPVLPAHRHGPKKGFRYAIQCM